MSIFLLNLLIASTFVVHEVTLSDPVGCFAVEGLMCPEMEKNIKELRKEYGHHILILISNMYTLYIYIYIYIYIFDFMHCRLHCMSLMQYQEYFN